MGKKFMFCEIDDSDVLRKDKRLIDEYYKVSILSFDMKDKDYLICLILDNLKFKPWRGSKGGHLEHHKAL